MASNQETENLSIRQIVEIEGKKFAITGTVDFNIKLIEDGGQPPKPEPKPNTGVDPTTGTIKEGSRWSKNPVENKPWKVTEMTDADKKGKFKIVDKEGLNVIADLESKTVAENLIKYFETNPFPPKSESTEPTDPDTIPSVVEGQNVDGVNLPYAITGKVKVNDFHWNKRDDGLRCDHEGLPKGEFINNVMVFYGTFKGDVPRDEITFKWSWDRHSKKGDLVKTYGVGMNNHSGETRYRMEWKHPSYTDNLAEGEAGLPVTQSVSLGYMGIRKTLANGNVLLEYWQDEGGLVDGKPANKWKKKLSTIDSEYKVNDYPNGIECTVRIDDDNGGWENVKVDKVILAELKP